MDIDLRLQILRSLCRDRSFLRTSAKDVDSESFPSQEEQVIAKAALDFYNEHEEPIGSLLRSEAEEAGLEARLGVNGRKHLKELINTIQGAKLELVPIAALQKRVRKLKEYTFYTEAVEQVVAAYEKHELNATLLADLVEKANRELADGDYQSRDYTDQLAKRIQRRREFRETKYPTLGIEPLDNKIRAVPRGSLAMLVASYASGKGMALIHFAIHYAIQGYKVLHISLEDPKEEVEDRLDAALTDLPKNRLYLLPNKLKNRFRRVKKMLRGRIRLIDGTDTEWTVSKVARAHEKERLDGFDADVVIVDYDDEIKPERRHTGESARRFEFADIYRDLRKLASKLDVIMWTASQGSKAAEGERVVTGKHAAEDISKIRKCFLAIGIGQGSKVAENIKHLYVIRHKMDRSRFGVDIVSNFSRSKFYDADKTRELINAIKNGNSNNGSNRRHTR